MAPKENITANDLKKKNDEFDSAHNTSVYLIPFYKKNIGEYSNRLLNHPDSLWQKAKNVDYKYLANHVKTIINGDEKFPSVLELVSKNRNKLKIPGKSSFLDQIGNIKHCIDVIPFSIQNIQIFCFPTNIGIMAIHIGYKSDIGLEDIAKFNASFVRFFNPSGGDSIPKYKYNGKFFPLYNIICNILEIDPQDPCSDPDNIAFPSFSYRKCYSYHVLKTTESEEATEKYRLQLIRGIQGDDVVGSFNEISYHQNSEILRNISSSGSVFMWHGGKHFIKSVYDNCLKGFLILYVLAIQEREILLRYHNIIVSKSNNMKELSKVRKELMENSIKYSYSIVSNEVNYQYFYEQLSNSLQLSTLLNEIQEVTEKVDDYVKGEKDGRMNALLSAIGILAIISALTDGVAFVESILLSISKHTEKIESNVFAVPYYIMFIAIALVVLFGICLYFGKFNKLLDFCKKRILVFFKKITLKVWNFIKNTLSKIKKPINKDKSTKKEK